MFKIFYTNNDSTIYEGYPEVNTGIDELLEIGKRYSSDLTSFNESRALVKFDINEIKAALTKYSVNINNCKFMLQLYTTHAKNLPADYTITANIVAQPWINGTGFLTSTTPAADGVTWNYPSSGSTWISSSQNIQYKSSSLFISGSGNGGSWLYETSSSIFNITYFNQSFATNGPVSYDESFNRQPTDINLDITNAVKIWVSGSGGIEIDNNGLILRYSDAAAANDNITGYINYFSRETHTIYVPKLIMYWDNSTYTTGSLTGIDLESFSVYTHVKPTYKDTEIAKIRIYGRDKFPQKSATNLFPIQTIKTLPSTTYYTVKDAATDETIIPYDDIYTKVSCDSTSNFIHLDLNGFMPERYYRLELKLVDGITEQYITDQIYFKVVR